MYAKKTLLALVGIPGSGKTTLRNKLYKETEDAVYVNRDEIRKVTPRGSMKIREYENIITDNEQIKLKELLENGHDLVIADNTHLNDRSINKLKELAKRYGYIFELKFLEDSFNVELCHKRNTNRPYDQHVPAYVIEKMAEQFANVWFKHYGKDVVIKKDRQKAIIVDLDGTLAENTTRGAFEWQRVGEDKLHKDVRELVRFYKSTGHTIIALSGRDAVCYPETYKWLVDNEIPFDMLYMRPVNDCRKDVYIKLEIYRYKIMADYDVKVCLDDRIQVVRAWRGIGLRCFQVQSGWF